MAVEDWSFAFQNQPQPRPRGEIILVSVSGDRRFLVLKDADQYFLLCQVSLARFQQRKLLDYEALIEARQKFHPDSDAAFLDLDYPEYNIEWSGTISGDQWHSLYTQLQALTIPLRLVGLPIPRQSLWWHDRDNRFYLTWAQADPRLEPLEEIMVILRQWAQPTLETAYYYDYKKEVYL